MKHLYILRRLSLALALIAPVFAQADEITDDIALEYENYLADLFQHFHSKPELSFQEEETAARMADELRAVGFEVTENVGRTGLVAILENGAGPMVAMRADMDALPVQEKTGLPYASTAQQADPNTGQPTYVMHACGHDVHITSLVGTARQLAKRRDAWSGTAMLLVQPAEELGQGARAMKDDGLWERFGTPDYVLGFHVAADKAAWTVNLLESESPYAGVDMVDIIVHGVGAHGASPHAGKDPIVLGSQIVMALQTLVSRELPPRDAGVVTVGSFHAGTKHNIISDGARLQLTVRNTKPETRELLLNGIRRIAENMGRAAGLPEELLPEVIVQDSNTPPMLNDPELAGRLNAMWTERMGAAYLTQIAPTGMGGEDFGFFSIDPSIPSAFWRIGGTSSEKLQAAEAGGPPVPSHHSPLFQIEPEPSIRMGVESSVRAMMELMPAG